MYFNNTVKPVEGSASKAITGEPTCARNAEARYTPSRLQRRSTYFPIMTALAQYDGQDVVARCTFENCNARIIQLSAARVASRQQITNAPPMLGEGSTFVAVADVWDFDNIGVSRPAAELAQKEKVGDLLQVERVLVCSECDRGPLGFAGHVALSDANDTKSLQYYLSCDSVKLELAAART